MKTEDDGIQIVILGTGTSTGVPVIGCSCDVCMSDDPRDKRLRCSCYVKTHGVELIIDVGPDFRTQAMRAGISNVDAVLITHHHFDHVVGLDDLRPFLFENRTAIPCYASPNTVEILNRMFGYIFRDGTYPGTPNLVLNAVDESFQVTSRTKESVKSTVIPVPAEHGDLMIYGYRIGKFAYLTDTSRVPDESLPLLQDLDVLVLDALRHRPHSMHLTISQAVDVAQQIGARQTYFIHMAHSVLHAKEDAKLPDRVSFAYDGLSFSVGS